MATISASPPTAKTLADVLQGHAEQRADRVAYVFFRDEVEESITYAELDLAARHIAAELIRDGAAPGDRAMLLFPSGLDFIVAFMGCLYAGVIAVPAYPPLRDIKVLENIAADCSPKFILATSEIRKRTHARFGRSFICESIAWKTPAAGTADSLATLPIVSGDAVAMLQYTSGSTGLPKGVVITHWNLIANLAAIKATFGVDEETVAVCWLPLYHDMGLIGNVLATIYAGSRLCLMSPQDFVQEPFRWLRAISRYKAHVSGGPNFAYQLCIDRITPAQMAQLDLSSWRVAYNGAEPVRSKVLERFAEKFDACRFSRQAFQPCYGMAETTLLVSTVGMEEMPLVRYVNQGALEENRVAGSSRGNKTAVSLVSCGHVIDRHRVAIVDPHTAVRRMQDQVGEIWIQGPSVAQAYWNKPDLSTSVFGARISNEEDSGRYLRTGDLGFIRDGHLFITGRQKDVIILRGRNYYPQDLELVAAESHAALMQDGTVAFEIDADNSAGLVIVQEVKRASLKGFDAALAAAAMRTAVTAAFQIDMHAIVFIGPHRLPRTSSGKVQRAQTRRMYLNEELSPIATQMECDKGALQAGGDAAGAAALTPLELALRAEIAKMVKVRATLLPHDRPLMHQGLDSLTQLELTHRLQHRYGIEITVEQFFDGLTIADLALQIEHLPAGAVPRAVEREDKANEVQT